MELPFHEIFLENFWSHSILNGAVFHGQTSMDLKK